MSDFTLSPYATGAPNRDNPTFSGEVWADIWSGAGTNLTGGVDGPFSLTALGPSDSWDQLSRPVFRYATAAMTGDATSGEITVVGVLKLDQLGVNPTLSCVLCTPGTPGTVTAADYGTYSATRVTDDVTYAAFNDAGNNVIPLNAAGIVALNAARAGSGDFSVMFRFGFDTDDAEPTPWAANQAEYLAFSAPNPTLTGMYGPPPPAGNGDVLLRMT